MGVKFTKEQRLAIDTRDADMLVSAGAGSGKTAVLVQRVIDIVTDEKSKTDIDRLLIVTFTKAAASEMRMKIQNALFKKAQESQNPHIQRQLTLLPKAGISTIHSFCSDVIRTNFHLTDLDPNFKVSEEAEADILKQEALSDVMEQMFEDETDSKDFYDLLDYYSNGKDDSVLFRLILDIYQFSQSMPFPEEWLRESCENFSLQDESEIFQKPFGIFLLEYLNTLLNEFIKLYHEAMSRIHDELDGLSNYLEPFETELGSIFMAKEALKHRNFDEIAQSFHNIAFSRLKPCKKGYNVPADQVKKMRLRVKEEVEKLKESVFYASGQEMIAELREIYPKLNCIAVIEKRLTEKYAEKKKEKNIIDFNDLEHYAISVLTEKTNDLSLSPSKAALELREKFDYILIDEYQDSNLVQEYIFNSIKKENNLFMVGDVKQSIYRFRNAMPDLFLQKYRSYPNEVKGGKFKVCLYQNFRSRKSVLDFVNFVFCQIMSEKAGETEYTKDEFLNLGARYKETGSNYNVEVHLIEKNAPAKEEAEDLEEPEISGIEAQAVFTAKRIKRLLFEEKLQIYDKDKDCMRRAEFRDIVILFRATKNKSDIFYNILTSFDIPVYADTSSGFFEATEIRVMLSLLKVIDNPRIDIELVSVLRSPIFSFDENLLMQIRLHKRDGYFYDAIEAFCEKSEKCRNFLAKLTKWRKMATDTSVDQLIYELYQDTGYESYVSALKNGRMRAANLRALYQHARQFEQSSFKGLFYFVSYMNRLKENEKDFSNSKIISENQNVVRVLSIHKSKGLEFPVVFLLDLDKRFNRNDLKNALLMHHELGIAPDFVDIKHRISYPTFMKEAIKLKLYQESLSEEMRILYVALTRAREKLILVGCVNDADKTFEKWSHEASFKKSPVLDVLKSNSYLDFIGPCLMKHQSLLSYNRNENVINFYPEFNEPVELFIYPKNAAVHVNREESARREQKTEAIEWQALEDTFDEEKEVSERLEYTYPFLKAGKIPAKVSVTQLKGLEKKENAEDFDRDPVHTIEVPSFLKPQMKLSAAQKGTLLHLYMQLIDPQKTETLEDIDFQINGFYEKEFITKDEADTVDRQKILNFFHSSLGKRLKCARSLYREQRFFLKTDAKVMPDTGLKDEQIAIQGVIDCFFEEKDGIVLLDYKTDHLEEKEKFCEKYASQLYYYALAIETLLKKPVTERYIYSFYLEDIIKI